jgi:hypothetical protein
MLCSEEDAIDRRTDINILQLNNLACHKMSKILDITGSGQEAMADSCNESNKPLGVMKGGEFFSKSEQQSASQDRL